MLGFKKHAALFIAAAVALSLAFFGFAKSPNLPEIKEANAFVPRAEAVKWMSLGYNSAAASLFWIGGIIAYSETMFDGKIFKWLSHVADASTRLDSLFKTPYTFVVAITANNEPDTTDYALLRRGVKTFPDDWRLAVSTAFRFANGPGKDYAYAAKIMKPFENDTAAPEHIRGTARTFELRAMPLEVAIAHILDDYLNPDYKAFQRGLAIKAARVLNSKEIDKIESILNDAAKQKIEPQTAFMGLIKMNVIPNNP
ncbi:MAG: hypothetical protein LBQ76_06270 [Candidatus Fibromonas sp.]|jgi:hypothetical protein|nr:hypothetical protein [Candidatus Fibromonas sp.]